MSLKRAKISGGILVALLTTNGVAFLVDELAAAIDSHQHAVV